MLIYILNEGRFLLKSSVDNSNNKYYEATKKFR